MKNIVLGVVGGMLSGLAICYDLCVADLLRRYATAGAHMLFVPAAFTRTTGEAHRHALLRAGAIENGALLIAHDDRIPLRLLLDARFSDPSHQGRSQDGTTGLDPRCGGIFRCRARQHRRGP
ncbi:hypothetical protein LCM17_02190 [Cereibacter sphaeroides]|nr:hypothetical protein [Cereibacter sphaeroides]